MVSTRSGGVDLLIHRQGGECLTELRPGGLLGIPEKVGPDLI